MRCFRPKTKKDSSNADKRKENDAEMSGTERNLKVEKMKFPMTHKIPVVGLSDSGKSTLMKQIRILHLGGFDDSSRREMVADIRRNIRDSLLSITGAMSRIDPPVQLEQPESAEMVQYLQQSATAADFDYPSEFFDYCSRLWKGRGVQETYSRADEFQVIDSAKWFLDRCAEIGRMDYLPDEQDILRCRVPTSETSEVMFRCHSIMYHMIDFCAGQKNERRKWIQILDDITALLFVCGCSDYNLKLQGDDGTQKTRLDESIDLFEAVWNGRHLQQASVILFLNKQDIFREKILSGGSKLQDYFPDYSRYPQPPQDPQNPSEPGELTRAKRFVRDRFLAITAKTAGNNRQCYPHFTTAVDTEATAGDIGRSVAADCQSILQRTYMTQLNLM